MCSSLLLFESYLRQMPKKKGQSISICSEKMSNEW
jgi:hypothetical protein